MYHYKNTDKEAEIEDAKALAYAEGLANREVRGTFGMGVDDEGY
tara:strand:- start:1839 stop:1970 length:132 start_codon:yes stop_codon:yes gene_type:complete